MSSSPEWELKCQKNGVDVGMNPSEMLCSTTRRFSLLQAVLSTGVSQQALPIGRNSGASPQLSTAELRAECLKAEIFLLGRTENLNSHQMRSVSISLHSWFLKDPKMNVSAICLRQADSCVPAKLCDGLLFNCTFLTQRHCPVCKLTIDIWGL